jgi:integrase
MLEEEGINVGRDQLRKWRDNQFSHLYVRIQGEMGQQIGRGGRRTSIKRANEKLSELRIEAISERVTPHSLRRTYASLRAALQDDMLYVSEQMGHKDLRFTLNRLQPRRQTTL